MNSKQWKKKLQEEVQPEELIQFIQKITSVSLPPIQFQGLLKLFCVGATIREETEPNVETEVGAGVEVEEVQEQNSQPGALACADRMVGQDSGSNGCAPNGLAPSGLTSKPKPKARPYDELLSELIDKYIQLKKAQRAEILGLLDELEKENKPKPKPKR